jgi:hypothetical protein
MSGSSAPFSYGKRPVNRSTGFEGRRRIVVSLNDTIIAHRSTTKTEQ